MVEKHSRRRRSGVWILEAARSVRRGWGRTEQSELEKLGRVDWVVPNGRWSYHMQSRPIIKLSSLI